MAKFLNENVYIEVDGNDISDHCFNIDTPSTKEKIDVSGFNATGSKSFLAGAKEDVVTFGVLQDFATGSVHDILSDLYQNEATFTLKIRPDSAVVSATNPELSGTAQMLSYNGLSGDLGERSEIEVELIPASGTGFVWANT